MKFQIEVNEQQLTTLIKATEIMARLGCGQIEDALRLLPKKNDIENHIKYEDLEAVKKVCSTFTKVNIAENSYLSISAEAVSEQAKVSYDLHQTMRHAYYWNKAIEQGVVESLDSPRNWSHMMQVYYDDPLLVSEQPQANVVKIDEL